MDNLYPIFEKRLRQIGFHESRTVSLSNAIGELHIALCYLDIAHIEEIKKLGLETLIRMFANCEELRNPLKEEV